MPRSARRRGRVASRAVLLALLLSGLVASAAVLPASAAPATAPAPAAAPAAAAHAPAAPHVAAAPAAIHTENAMVPVGAEPDGTAVSIDTTLYEPSGGTDHPAVLLAHGFGGTKADTAELGRSLAEGGYVVVTWTARGFGQSGGRIHLDDPAYEVADARKLVDILATRPEVRLDASGDPRVGVAGGSYGGALSLMLGAIDKRIDAVVASITWNDLAQAFFPENVATGSSPTDGPDSPAALDRSDLPGPFKQLWASRFFVGTATAGASINPTCGRFDATICRLFLDASATGTPSDELLALLRDHSPKPLLAGLTAPTFLVQGMHDTLFGLDQSDDTARTLIGQGNPVAVRWMDGGHDGLSTTDAADAAAQRTWMDHYLLPDTKPSQSPAAAALPVPSFAFAEPVATGATAATFSRSTATYEQAATWSPLAVDGAKKLVVNPPGGQPASITLVPGLAAGGLGSLATALPTYPLAALSGQSAAFDTAPLTTTREIVGAPRLRLTVESTATSATLFLSLWQVTGTTATLPRTLVAPVTVATSPGKAVTVDVALPAATWRVPAGSALRVLVTTTDSTYAAPRTARADLVAVSDLRLPQVAATPLTATGAPAGEVDLESAGVGIAIAVLLLLLLGSALWRRRRRQALTPRDDLADVPLVVDHLVKTYADGHRAVDDVSWQAGRGQVVGLLGPNGAGKTTTLRMVMGLIRPDSGTAHILGQPVTAGASVLARVGALIEGPGFLPHLTGRQNLRAYWAATGRPESEAGYDEVLEVAALGGAVDRPVRSYSQGMRQRLGIAQAMLGLPEVLVLDEPTNGLDPPQIAGMRPILQRYAQGGQGKQGGQGGAGGRTVVVSSHLLSEVEVTCSHVVVMHAGRVVTTGTVAELVDSSDTTVLEVATAVEQAETVAAALRGVDGVTGVEVADDGATSRLLVTAGLARADVVRHAVELGADVVGVSSRKHLEEVFLGVIAAAGAAGAGEDAGSDPGSLTERLRQVRSR